MSLASTYSIFTIAVLSLDASKVDRDSLVASQTERWLISNVVE